MPHRAHRLPSDLQPPPIKKKVEIRNWIHSVASKCILSPWIMIKYRYIWTWNWILTSWNNHSSRAPPKMRLGRIGRQPNKQQVPRHPKNSILLNICRGTSARSWYSSSSALHAYICAINVKMKTLEGWDSSLLHFESFLVLIVQCSVLSLREVWGVLNFDLMMMILSRPGLPAVRTTSTDLEVFSFHIHEIYGTKYTVLQYCKYTFAFLSLHFETTNKVACG